MDQRAPRESSCWTLVGKMWGEVGEALDAGELRVDSAFIRTVGMNSMCSNFTPSKRSCSRVPMSEAELITEGIWTHCSIRRVFQVEHRVDVPGNAFSI